MIDEIDLHKELEVLKSELYYIKRENTIIVNYLCKLKVKTFFTGLSFGTLLGLFLGTFL